MRTNNEKTYIFDPESPTELARLINQDRHITTAVGGELAGLPELPEEATILDVACGPGGWVLGVAFALPNAEVCGVDISTTMVSYANARARSEGRSNASFGVMDITQPLDFAAASFDLVNARFLMGVLKREAWAPFLAECTRVLRPGGIVRLTEGTDAGESTSPALERLTALAIQALWHAGYGFSSTGRTFGLSAALTRLLRQTGYTELHLSSVVLDSSPETQGWAHFFHDQQIMLLQIKPLLVQMGEMTPDEFDHWYQDATIEMHQEEFAAVGTLLSIWARKPEHDAGRGKKIDVVG